MTNTPTDDNAVLDPISLCIFESFGFSERYLANYLYRAVSMGVTPQSSANIARPLAYREAEK